LFQSDWNDFINDITWFVRKDDKVEISACQKSAGELFKPIEEFQIRFPLLTRLLSQARITKIKINKKLYYLFAWTNSQKQSLGWLCAPPGIHRDNIELHKDHKVLLKCFGGILEHWNRSGDTWLANLNSALVESEAYVGFKDWGNYIEEICADEGLTPYINSNDYIVFATEANGNCTAYHKVNGEVIIFASDHAFDHVECLEGYPEYTLYRIKECNDFASWVENIASQWLDML
jgi:hypothetical protein